ncbi:MAG: helix-turn-helix domain-containing protein [Chitinophagaceae bacterium]
MKTISILALRNAVLASVADTRHVFVKVNELLKQAGGKPLFRVQLVGATSEIELEDGLFSMRPDVLIEDVKKTDLVIIPSLTGDMMTATHLNREYAAWVAQQYKNGAEVAALCTGAFLLAFSGVLKNKECTTHWAYANEFRYFYPLSLLVDEKLITDQNGVYTSGGNNAYWNLLIHLVEKYTDRNMAIRAAKYFVIDLNKNIQSPFIIFNGLKDHDDAVVLQVQEYIERNFLEKFTVDDLSLQFNTVRRTLERRFRKATRNTIAEYIQRVKMEAAKKQLETGNKTVNEIMLDVGYADIQAFRGLFKKLTGMTPVSYRDKYNPGNADPRK